MTFFDVEKPSRAWVRSANVQKYSGDKRPKVDFLFLCSYTVWLSTALPVERVCLDMMACFHYRKHTVSCY